MGDKSNQIYHIPLLSVGMWYLSWSNSMGDYSNQIYHISIISGICISLWKNSKIYEHLDETSKASIVDEYNCNFTV